MAGAVPSTLHQQIKLIIDGNLVTISAECDDPSPPRSGLPVIHVDESAAPASFQALEISTPHYRCLGAPAVKPRVSPELTFVAKEMIRMNFQPGQGLGKSSQGITEPIHLPQQIGKAGLGYHVGTARRHHRGATPIRLVGSPVTKVDNEQGISGTVIGAGSEELTPARNESARRESFLREVAKEFEIKCYIPGQSTSSKEGTNVISPPGAQQVVPAIDWAGLIIPGADGKEDSGDIFVIIGEVSDVRPSFIQRISADLTIDNWTLKPVISKQG